MSDAELDQLAIGIQTIPGRPLGTSIETPFRVTQVVSITGINDSPPVIQVGDPIFPTEMRVVGNVWDYHPGQTVVYQQRDGMSLVLGVLAHVGSEDDPLEEDFPPWHEVGASGEPGFQSSWVNYDGGTTYDTAGFMMQSDGWVRLKGLIKDGTVTAGANIFDLPFGWAPPWNCTFNVMTNGVLGVLGVNTAGQVEVLSDISNVYCSLSGITFPAGWALDGAINSKLYRGHWEIPFFESGWNRAAVSGVDNEIEIFQRSDGWCWMKGVLDTGTTVPGKVGDLPDRTAPGWRAYILPAYSSAGVVNGARHDIGGGDPSSNRAPATWRAESGGGAGQDHYLGGMNWWGRGALRSAHTMDASVPTLINSWAVFGADFHEPRYWKDAHGIVHLFGMLQGSSSTDDIMFNLPAGWRPLKRQVFPSIYGGGSSPAARVDVFANGDVAAINHPNTTWQSISGITFRAMQ